MILCLSRILSFTLLALLLGFAPACSGAPEGLPLRNTGQYATIQTEHGNIVIELYPKVAPQSVENFDKLVKKGFYDGLTFHRVEPGFVAQGGDPDGTGAGGPGYDIPGELSQTEKHLRGTLAMARKGDEVNPQRRSSGSQFYICLEPAPFLDKKYAIFGGVVSGMEVVDKIRRGDQIKKITLSDKPPK